MWIFTVLWAFSSCGERGLLSSCGARASYCSDFSCCEEQAQQLWCMGLAAPRHMESFQTRDQTCVFCTSRWILNHWTTREVPSSTFLMIYRLTVNDPQAWGPVSCLLKIILHNLERSFNSCGADTLSVFPVLLSYY